MAALRDRRHEVVARCLALMMTPEEASREAGYRDGTSFADNARKRSHRPDIRARVLELQSAQASLVEINIEWIRRKAARIAGVDFDREDIRPSDAGAMLNLLAKMTPGALVPQKIEAAGADGGPILMGEVTDEDRVKALAAFVAKTKAKSDAL